MDFKEGFDAIEDIKASSIRLSEIVENAKQVADRLLALEAVEVELKQIVENTKPALEQLKSAELKLADMQRELLAQIEGLPKATEAALDTRLSSDLSRLETKLAERLQAELSDTRASLRDAFQVSEKNIESRIVGLEEGQSKNFEMADFNQKLLYAMLVMVLVTAVPTISEIVGFDLLDYIRPSSTDGG